MSALAEIAQRLFPDKAWLSPKEAAALLYPGMKHGDRKIIKRQVEEGLIKGAELDGKRLRFPLDGLIAHSKGETYAPDPSHRPLPPMPRTRRGSNRGPRLIGFGENVDLAFWNEVFWHLDRWCDIEVLNWEGHRAPF